MAFKGRGGVGGEKTHRSCALSHVPVGIVQRKMLELCSGSSLGQVNTTEGSRRETPLSNAISMDLFQQTSHYVHQYLAGDFSSWQCDTALLCD